MRLTTMALASTFRTHSSFAISAFGICAPYVLGLASFSSAGWIVELPTQDRQAIVTLLRAGQFAQLDQRYETFQHQYENGQINDRDITLQYQAFYDTSPENEAYLNQWVAENPKSYPARLARGIYYASVGGKKRGGKWAQETPDEQMIELSKFLDLSNRDVVDSLFLTAKPIVSLLQLLKSSQHRDGKLSNPNWLNYANRIDPTNYGARRRYMATLTPRWGGSYDEMWKFFKECSGQNLPSEHLRVFESQIYLDQAKTFAERNQRDTALPLYRKALGLLNGIDNTERLDALKGVVYNGNRTTNLEDFSQEIDETLRLAPQESRILSYRAWIRFKQGRFEEGLKDYSMAAELGDDYSQFQFGKQLYYGVPPTLMPNQQQGLTWIKKSAEQGHEAAQRFLEQLGLK